MFRSQVRSGVGVCTVLLSALVATACSDDAGDQPGGSGGSSNTAGAGSGGAAGTGASAGAAGTGQAGTGGTGGSGGGNVDEFGCNLETEVSCDGQCFATVGEQKGACRLVRWNPAGFAGLSKVNVLVEDGQDLFYADSSGLGAVRLDSLSDEELSGAPKYVDEIVASGDYVYVATQANDAGTFGPGTVQRVPRAGGEAESLVNGVTGAGSLTVVGETLFFTIGFGSLYSMPAAGGAEPTDTMVSASSLVADGTDLIFSVAGVTNFPIQVAPADDLESAVEIVADAFDPTLVGVHDGFVYWFDDEDNYQRVAKAGGSAETVRAAGDFWHVAHSPSAVFSSTTTSGASTVRVMPIAGGEPVEVAAFGAEATAVTGTPARVFVAVGQRGAIFEITL